MADPELVKRLRERAGQVARKAMGSQNEPATISIPRSTTDVDMMLCEAADALEAQAKVIEALRWALMEARWRGVSITVRADQALVRAEPKT